MIPEIVSQDLQETTNQKGNKEFFTKLNMVFTWVNIDNPDEKIVCQWTAQGLDNAEKGIGKALTYAEKYFLLKFFNIATDKDDPDKFQEKMDNTTKKNAPIEQVKAPAPSPEDVKKQKEQEQMQKDFIAAKNGTIFQWTNAVKKWLDKKPELAGSESFDKWALKYKPESKEGVEA